MLKVVSNKVGFFRLGFGSSVYYCLIRKPDAVVNILCGASGNGASAVFFLQAHQHLSVCERSLKRRHV